MMILTNDLGRLVPADIRAKMLLMIDQYLRESLYDEDLFARWLEEGVPDGTESWEELADIEVADFVEMWNLAESLMNEQAVNKEEDEPHDIDDDCGFDPYEGCYTWDC